jgi:hypothetical protein
MFSGLFGSSTRSPVASVPVTYAPCTMRVAIRSTIGVTKSATSPAQSESVETGMVAPLLS